MKARDLRIGEDYLVYADGRKVPLNLREGFRPRECVRATVLATRIDYRPYGTRVRRGGVRVRLVEDAPSRRYNEKHSAGAEIIIPAASIFDSWRPVDDIRREEEAREMAARAEIILMAARHDLHVEVRQNEVVINRTDFHAWLKLNKREESTA